MLTDNLVIGCIGRSYFMESIVTIHSEYYELFIKDDSIYLMTYAFIVKK